MAKEAAITNGHQRTRRSTAGARTKASLAKQPLAAILVAEGASARSIARTLNVAPNTVTRWRADPEFAALVARERESLNESHREKARRLTDRALDKAIDAVEADDRGIIARVLSQSHLFSYGQGGEAGEHRVRAEGQGVVVVREYHGVAPGDGPEPEDGPEPDGA